MEPKYLEMNRYEESLANDLRPILLRHARVLQANMGQIPLYDAAAELRRKELIERMISQTEGAVTGDPETDTFLDQVLEDLKSVAEWVSGLQ